VGVVGSVDRGGIDQVGRGTQVSARHHVGERVVVHDLVVLVGAYHAIEVCSSLGVVTHPGGPVLGGFDDEGPSGPGQEGVVTAPLAVVTGRPRHVGHDVLFVFAGADRDDVAV